MTKTLRHRFNSAISDVADATLVRPSAWDDDHDYWTGYRLITATSDTIALADHLSSLVYNLTAPGTATLLGSTALPPTGWSIKVYCIGAGAVALSGSGVTVNGDPSLTLWPGESAEIIGTGSANYFANVMRAPASARYGGALSYVDATHLAFKPYDGNAIKINGIVYLIPAAGITVANTGVAVDGVANANLAGSTSYFVFALQPGVLFSDNLIHVEFRTLGGTVSHGTSTTPGNEGVETLLISGIEYPTRTLIGMCRTASDGTFGFTAVNAWVRSWRRPKPACVTGVAFSGTSASTSWINMIGGDAVNFLVWSNEQVRLFGSGLCYNNPGNTSNYFLPGIDGANDAGSACYCWVGPYATFSGFGFIRSRILTEGYHSATLMCAVASGTAYVQGVVVSALIG